jgi:hypothetical protein
MTGPLAFLRRRRVARERAIVADYLDGLAQAAQAASFKNRNVYESGATAWLRQEARKLRAGSDGKVA